MRIALFESECIQFILREEQEKHTNTTRVSEYIDVEFTMLPRAFFVANKIEKLGKEIKELEGKKEKKLEEINLLKTVRNDVLEK